MIAESLIPEEILKAYDIFLQYRIIERIVEPLKVDLSSKINKWRFSCLVEIPYPNVSSLPKFVELEFVLFDNYPLSDIFCYSKTELVQGFPHQDSETRKLCLKDKQLAPKDETKLAIYVTWAIEWLNDAANNKLVNPTDPYELPDFSRKFYKVSILTKKSFLFNEDAISYTQWVNYLRKSGTVICNSPSSMHSFFINEYSNDKSLNIKKDNFSPYLYDIKKNFNGLWVIIDNIYYLNYRPPQTFKEIRELFNRYELDFDMLLKKAWEIKNADNLTFILVGFPIPKIFFGKPVEIHWVPLVINNIRHSRQFTKAKKTKKIWFEVLSNEFADKKQLPWCKSYNINHSRLFSRGSLNPYFKGLKVSLIGCGAIGSIVSENLIRGGISELNLFDYDIVEPGNLCRHTLDGTNLGYVKSNALRQRLLTVNPLANIKSFISVLPLDSKQKDELDALMDSDILIDCTTDDSAFQWINKFAFNNKKRLLSVFINFHATVLTLLISGVNKSCLGVFQSLIKAVKDGNTGIIPTEYFSNPTKEEQIIEGIGCWHPTFPGLNIHITLLVSSALELLNNKIGNSNGLAALIKLNDDHLKKNTFVELAYLNENYE